MSLLAPATVPARDPGAAFTLSSQGIALPVETSVRVAGTLLAESSHSLWVAEEADNTVLAVLATVASLTRVADVSSSVGDSRTGVAEAVLLQGTGTLGTGARSPVAAVSNVATLAFLTEFSVGIVLAVGAETRLRVTLR